MLYVFFMVRFKYSDNSLWKEYLFSYFSYIFVVFNIIRVYGKKMDVLFISKLEE